MTTVTAQEIEDSTAHMLSKKTAADVTEINTVLAELEAVIVEMMTYNHFVNEFICNNAEDIGFILYQAEHAKLQKMIMECPNEQVNGLNQRHWRGDKFPVSNWKKHIKDIIKYMKTLKAEYESLKDNGIVVSWWVD